MGSIVFLPGILGSRLSLDGEEVWPPTLWEAINGYDRLDQLRDDRVTAGGPIDAVACAEFYAPLLADLRAICAGTEGAPTRRLHALGYDWRRDIRDSARSVAAALDGLLHDETGEVILVGHSMGCLLHRWILESGECDARPWFARIAKLVSLAGPHRGAPTALVRAAGLEGTAGLAPEDIRHLAADARYPSLYQLFPAPGIAAVWDASHDAMRELDLYEPSVAVRIGLAAANCAPAEALHVVLGANRRPAAVEYVDLAGAGRDTWLRLELRGSRKLGIKGEAAGDGTVPLWSAVEPGRPHHAAPADHASVFRNEEIRALLFRALGARMAGTAFSVGGLPAIQVSTPERVHALGSAIDASLTPVVATTVLRGELLLDYSERLDAPAFRPLQAFPVVAEGLPLRSLTTRLAPPGQPGLYRLGFRGSHAVRPGEEAAFVVSRAG
jgi:hypothetical protein